MDGDAAEKSRRGVFWLEMGYLALLGISAWLFLTEGFPSWFDPPTTIGPMPVGVPWYGSLGGVVISLTGVFEQQALLRFPATP